MKTVSLSNAARLLPFILLILVFTTGCKKEEKVFPLGDIQFALTTANSNGIDADTFAYGDDIYFVLNEINPLKTSVTYYRRSNPPQYYFILYDDYGYVGRAVNDSIITNLGMQMQYLYPRQTTQIGVNWFNKPSNTILPIGKYTLKYTTNITIVRNDGIYNLEDGIVKQEILEKEFWIQ